MIPGDVATVDTLAFRWVRLSTSSLSQVPASLLHGGSGKPTEQQSTDTG